MTAPLLALAQVADDIRDIHGPIVAPPAHPWWPYLAAAAALVALGVAILAVVRRRRRALPADAQALRELEAARKLIERGDSDGFSVRVSDAVRHYVEAAFGVRAPRLTTEELLGDSMTEDSPVSAYRRELGGFLEFCDLAKYARWWLSRPQMTGMLDSAEIFVRATRRAHPMSERAEARMNEARSEAQPKRPAEPRRSERAEQTMSERAEARMNEARSEAQPKRPAEPRRSERAEQQ